MFSDHQPISEISVSELARRASAVIGGERVIVSRNGRPAAVILAIRDGVDALLAGSEEFAALRRDARDEIAGSRPERQVFVAGRAAAALEMLRPQHRNMLERKLNAGVRRHDGREGLFSVGTPTDVAAHEVLAGGRIVIVYAVSTLVELRQKLFGPVLEERFWQRRWQAHLHGRSPAEH